MKTHLQMQKKNCVSFWLGDGIKNACELDAYLTRRFAEDFGFAIYAPAGPEHTRCDWSGEKAREPVEELLRRFSFSRPWAGDAATLARARGFTEARIALVFHAFEYDASLIRRADAPLSFIGAVHFGTPA